MAISLTKEKETLLIPLLGRARMSEAGLFTDKPAERVVNSIDYDFSHLRIDKKLCIFMALRAAIFDDYTLEFLSRNPDATVIYLGCGLDSRCERLGYPAAMWYDLDYAEVIELKRKFFEERESYQLIPSSVTELSWLDEIKKGDFPVLIIAEGLFMYLAEDDIRRLADALGTRFPNARIIFDAYSKTTAKYSKYQPSLRKTGAVIRWGVDSAQELAKTGLYRIETKYMHEHRLVERLSSYFRFMFRMSGHFKAVREAHRVFIADLK